MEPTKKKGINRGVAKGRLGQPPKRTEDKKKREFSIDFNLMNDFGDRSRTYVAIRRRLEENEFVSSIEHIGPKK